jgi:hypothetical protein
MIEALRVANGVDQDAPPELHNGLERIRHLLDCALETIDRAMDSDADWPGLAARGLSTFIFHNGVSCFTHKA